MYIINLLRKASPVLVFVVFIVPSPSLASKPDKSIPVRIQINIEWNHRGSGNTRRIGSFSVNVTGKAKMTKKEGEHIKYEPDGIQAQGMYNERIVMEEPDSKCYQQVIGRIEASGAVPITIRGEGAVRGRGGSLVISKNLGHLGTIAAMQYQGQVDRDAMLNPKKDTRDDNYTAFLVAGFRATFKNGLCNGPATTREGVIPVALTIFKEIDLTGMFGSYNWQAEATSPPSRIYIGDFHDDIRLGPGKGKGAHCRVSWTFGEVKPVVQIWWEDRNITDQKSQDVLVGQKIELEAVVKPPGHSLVEPKWDIDEDKGGNIVGGWVATKENAHVIPVERHSKRIAFCWVDGIFTGAPMKVKISGAVDGHQVHAETTFNVFKPEIEDEKVIPARKVTVGDMPEVETGELYCALYPGKVNIRESPPVAEPPGMFISHRVEIPRLPQDEGGQQPHLLQYVQLIKEDILENHNGYYKRTVNHQLCCDKNYPYNNHRASHRIEMNDTPGPELGMTVWELHHQHEFETYLMFIPSADPNDDQCVWIPLRKIKWAWAAAVKKDRNAHSDAPCNETLNRLLYQAPPQVSEKKNCKQHPKWSCNVSENSKKPREDIGTEGYDESNWVKLTNERKNKWGSDQGPATNN